MVLPGFPVGEWVVAGIPHRLSHNHPRAKVWNTLICLTLLRFLDYFYCWSRARSSVGEHFRDMVGVDGSIPSAPTSSK